MSLCLGGSPDAAGNLGKAEAMSSSWARRRGFSSSVVWLGWVSLFACVPVSGCSLLFGADEHQGGILDGGPDEGTPDMGVDAAERCEQDPDEDDDGVDAVFCGGTDCDDDDDRVYPGAPEVCGNGVDESCGGSGNTVRDLLGVTTSVTEFPARTLFSYERPAINDSPFVALTAMASTNAGGGWFVAASVEGDDGANAPHVLRATPDEPTSFTQIANTAAGQPALENLVGVTLARDGSGDAEPDIDVMAVKRAPDASNVLGYYGAIDAVGSDIAITSVAPMTTAEDVVFRPGAIMTGGVEPPRWVVGEVGAAASPDRLNSCRQGSSGTCNETDSTLFNADSEVPISAAGSPSGHVFFTEYTNGNLVVWNLENGGGLNHLPENVVSDAVRLLGRPAIAEMGVVEGTPNRHHYVMAVRYEDSSAEERLAVVPVVCARAQTLGSCLFGSAEDVNMPLGTPSGPLAIVGYGEGRFALFFGVRAAAGDALRMVTGQYDVGAAADPIDFVGERVLDTFPGNSGDLLEVSASYLERVTAPSVFVVMWQNHSTLVALETMAFSFCQEP